jgi:glycosyltransferase involved in cell wall biosynthesis
MRIAYLINQYPAISHTFIRREIRALEDMGVTIERFALRGWDSEFVDPLDLEELARTRHTLKDGTGRLILGALGWGLRRPSAFLRGLKLAFSMSKGAVRPWPYHLIYLAHACKIVTWLERTDVDHLHAHFGSNSAEIAALVEAIGGPSFSFTTHGSEVFDDPKRHALPLKIDRSRFAVTSCAYIGSQMMYHVPPAHWSKVNVVRCGLAASAFVGEAAPLPDVPVYLSVGRFSPEKGHLLLIEAFAAVHSAYPGGARLVLAGDGPMRAALEDRIAQLNLEQAVRITGWVTSDQVRKELRGARALVHPSFTEGLPVVIMEAMAERRPVISTFIAGIPELVQDGRTGWLVPAGQVKDLAQAMLACAAMPSEKLEAIGRAGFDRVRARHDASVEAAKLKVLIEAVGS